MQPLLCRKKLVAVAVALRLKRLSWCFRTGTCGFCASTNQHQDAIRDGHPVVLHHSPVHYTQTTFAASDMYRQLKFLEVPEQVGFGCGSESTGPSVDKSPSLVSRGTAVSRGRG